MTAPLPLGGSSPAVTLSVAVTFPGERAGAGDDRAVAQRVGGVPVTAEQIANARNELLEIQKALGRPGPEPLFESADTLRVAGLNRALDTSRAERGVRTQSVLGIPLGVPLSALADRWSAHRAEGLKRELVQSSIDLSMAQRVFSELSFDAQWNAQFRLQAEPKAVSAFDSVLSAGARLERVRAGIDSLIAQLESRR